MSAETKKKIRLGKIEVEDSECAIVVHYEAETLLKHPSGETEVAERKQSQKKIKIKTLNASSNIPLLAAEVTEKCKLIPSSRIGLVEELLYKLQKRELGVDYRGSHDSGGDYAGFNDQELIKRASQQSGQQRAQELDASVDELDQYMEALYEDLKEKVKATAKICQLARRTELIEVLLGHETLFGALARVLREDGRKSMDLAINILTVFFAVSNFSQCHHVISEHQVGDMTMRIIDLELKRSADREVELKEMQQAGKKLSEEQTQKLDKAERKQERLLYVCFYMLLNLAEDVTIERKMKKRNITVYLCKMLERKNVDLLILATTFLKKLSIYKENKDKMAECNIVDKLTKFVPVSNDVLLLCVLRLLLNLSFDPELRDNMVRNGLIPKVVELFPNPNFQHESMALLYHISMDDKCKSMFTYTNAIPMILNMLLQVEDLHSAPVLIALAVNLTQNQRNAEVMCEGDGLAMLMDRAMAHADPLAFKVVRNISQQDESVKLLFAPYIAPMVDALKDPATSTDLLVEILGTLGNLNIPHFDYTNLVYQHDLLSFLTSHIHPGVVEDDIMLEVVIFTGTIANEALAMDLVNSGLVEKLYELMSEKKDDDEFVLQITFTFSRLLLFNATREALLHYTQVVLYLVELLQDNNKEVRKTADVALDLVIDSDEELAEKVRQMKFEAHNHDWLEIIESDDVAASGDGAHVHDEHIYGRGVDMGDMESDDEVDYDTGDGYGAAYGDAAYGDAAYGDAAYGDAAYGDAAYADAAYADAAYGEGMQQQEFWAEDDPEYDGDYARDYAGGYAGTDADGALIYDS